MAQLRTVIVAVLAALIVAANPAWGKPSPGAGHTLQTVRLAVRHSTSAAPWRPPSAAHPLGTILLASLDDLSPAGSFSVASHERAPTLREIDAAKGDIIATHRLATRVTGYGLRVATTPRGAIVISGGSDEDHAPVRARILDSKLRVRSSVVFGRSGTDGNASADGDTAVVSYRFWTTINGEQRRRQAVETFSLSSGARMGATAVDQGPMPPHGEVLSQVVVSGSRVFVLSRGVHLDVYALSANLRRLFARYHRKMNDEFSQFGHATLVVGKGGVVVAGDDWATHLTRDLSRPTPIAGWPEEELGADRVQPAHGSADAATGRLVLDTGFLGKSLSSELERAAEFSREPYCPSGSCADAARPYFDDEPIAAFWLGGRATIVTRGPATRIVVVDP